MLDQAITLAWADAGCSLIPIRSDGSKAPAGPWKAAQHVQAGPEVITRWLTTNEGLGVVCGAVSRNLEMLELEGRAVAGGYGAKLREACRDNGLEHVLDIVLTGCRTRSPSGGYHLWYRVGDGPARGNTKLARRPGPGGTVEVLIETRGEGGYAVVPPSHGGVHPTGQPWTLDAGDPSTIPVITAEERDGLHAVASLLDEMPTHPDPVPAAAAHRSDSGGRRPGDDFNDRGTWDEILIPHGWTKARPLGRGWAWRRPGKTDPGISATTGQAEDADRMYVFTTSTTLPAEVAMSKLYVHAQLDHGGDLGAAVKALRHNGYGDPLPPRDNVRDLLPAGRPAPSISRGPGPATDGATALAEVVPLRPETLEHTDDANALRLVDVHHATIRRVSDMTRWHAWDGTRWRTDADEAHIRELARSIARTLTQNSDKDRTHKRNSLSSAGLSSAVRVASSDPRVSVRAEQLDAHPHLLNTPSGVLDLITGQISPHDPALLQTRITTCRADLEAPHPLWDAFLEETFGGDKELIGYVQQLAGLALLGDVREHILPLMYGTGANGKGVLLLVWQLLLGIADAGGYAQSAPDGFLMASRGDGHPTDVARLRGARLLVASEQTSGRRFDEAKVKRLTGGDTLTGRFMRGDFFDFTPSHLVIVATNHLPEVREGGPSFWRRARLIPFDHVVPEDRRDPELHNRLVAAEGPAILGWMARGALSVTSAGMVTPERVQAATENYRVSEDTVASFVRDECTIGGEYLWVKTAELYSRYEAHCRDMGSECLSQKALGMRLVAEYGTRPEKHSRLKMRIHRGIGLLAQDDDPDDDDEIRHREPVDNPVDDGSGGGLFR